MAFPQVSQKHEAGCFMLPYLDQRGQQITGKKIHFLLKFEYHEK